MNLKSLISETSRAKLVTRLTTAFALIYHICFLIIFFLLKITPMVYFNLFSVTLFICVYIAIHHTKSFVVPYMIADVEVIFHQILADYCLGSVTDFHFFILLMCILPYLIFEDRIRLAFITSFWNVVIFSLIQIFSENFYGIYDIGDLHTKIIQIINISISITVIAMTIFIFAFIVRKMEQALENEVHIQAKQLQIQNEHLISIQNNTIISLSNLVENRDSDTGEHVRRTSRYVELIAQKTMEAGFYNETINNHYIHLLSRAAPLHDIGKIVVSDVILKKPGKLTPEEFELMKLHTTEGGRIIKEIFSSEEDIEYLKTAGEIATYHHEKWDGTGYPMGLKGEEIPISARIMAIADVYDALISPRCYKKPFSTEDAIQIIKDSSGKHFDPIIATIFLQNIDEVSSISRQYSDNISTDQS